MNKNIEVEGGEIAIRNSHGDLAIIPKDKRDWVKQKLSEGCHSCIDSLVETLPVMEDYASDGSIMPNDNEDNFKYKSYTAAQDNTYVASRVVKEQNKKQQFVPRERPVLKADTRTDQERGIAQKYTEAVLNPSISTQIGETLQKPLRWLSDPVKGVGDIVSAIAPNSSLAKDLPNTHADTFEHRKKQLNPYTSNREKISNTINEAVPLTNMALLNILPVEAAAGNIVKSGKNLIKPVSKVVGKTDDAIKAGSKVLSKTDNAVKPIVSSVYDVAYPVTRTTPNSGYTFKTISPNKEKIAIHESNKYHDVMWVAKNDIDNFFINNKIDVSKLPESKLVGSEVGYDWILPEGITHDMLNEFARLHHGKPITQEMRNIAKAIKEANPNVKFSGTSHELHGIASNIHPDYLGKFGQGLSNVDKAGSKVLNKTDDVVKNLPKFKSETFNNLADKSKNISESVSYELNTLHKKLNPSYQKRAKKELKYANKWQEEWYNHPETTKRLQSLSDEFNTYRNQRIDKINKKNKILRENPDNLKLGYTQEELNYIYRDIPYSTENEWTEIIGRINDKNYTSTFQSKNAKLQKILKGEERTHKGNYGISGHHLDEDYSGVRQNLVDKYSSKIKTTAIHEGNHGLTEGNLLLPKSERDEMVKIFGEDKKIPVRNKHGEFNTYDEYLEDPTEIYARIMELREYMGKKPGELVSADDVEKLIQFGKNGNTPIDSYFFSKIQDKEKLKKLFNRLPAITPLIGISYLQSQQQNKTEQ